MTTLFLADARQNPGAPGIELLDSASLQEGPIYPNRPVMVFTGLLMGAIPAALIAMIRRGRVLGAAVTGAMAGTALMICFITWSRWWSGPAAVATVSMDGGAAGLEDSIAAVLSGPKLEVIAGGLGLSAAELKANLSVTGAMPEDRHQRLVRFTFKHEDGWLAEAVVAEVVAGVFRRVQAPGRTSRVVDRTIPLLRTGLRAPSRHGLPVGALLGATAAFALAQWRRRSVSPKLMYGT